MSNLQPNCCLEFDFRKVDQHAGGKWLIHDTNNGLSPGLHQAIIWTNDGILLIIKSHSFSFKKMHLKMSSGKWRPFCLSLNVLTVVYCDKKGYPIQTLYNAAQYNMIFHITDNCIVKTKH